VALAGIHSAKPYTLKVTLRMEEVDGALKGTRFGQDKGMK